MITWCVRRMARISPAAWRRVALVYYLVLTTGTHWPKLRVGAPGPIPVDKILHAIAFCGLAGLLMLTRLLERRAPHPFTPRNVLRVTAVTLVLGALDEITQALPGQDRFPGWDDYFANCIGIAIAGLVALMVFRPVAARRSAD